MVAVAQDRARQTAELSSVRQELSERTHGTVHEVDGIEIRVISDLEFESPSIIQTEESECWSLVTLVSNADEQQAAEAFFDVTAYDENGAILDRVPAINYLLPDQRSVFEGAFTSESLEAASIVIEQTRLEFGEPSVPGGYSVGEFSGTPQGRVEVEITSSLGAVAEFTSIYIVGFVGDEIFAVCDDYQDVPEEGAFTATCVLEISKEAPTAERADGPAIPENAEFGAYLALDLPF